MELHLRCRPNIFGFTRAYIPVEGAALDLFQSIEQIRRQKGHTWDQGYFVCEWPRVVEFIKDFSIEEGPRHGDISRPHFTYIVYAPGGFFWRSKLYAPFPSRLSDTVWTHPVSQHVRTIARL